MSYMDQALTLARQSLGEVHPNPPVGAVLVRNGKVISEGITQLPGGPHAEIMALAELDYKFISLCSIRIQKYSLEAKNN